MKNIIKKIILITTLTLSLVGCINDDNYDVPPVQSSCDSNLTANKTVDEIYNSTVGTNPQQHTGDDVIEAYVVSSDEAGNIFKTLYLQSTTKSRGIKVPVDADPLYTKYKVGQKVFIKLKDLYKRINFNAFEIGDLFISSSNVPSIGRIAATKYGSVIIRSCEPAVNEEDLVVKLKVSELNDSHLNKLVEIDNVQFTTTDAGKPYYDAANAAGGATDRQFVDPSITTSIKAVFRTSSFATFKNDITPDKNGKIRGILTKFSSTYQILGRTINDVKLTEPRK
ncbi:DUF5689 domain-containing protein [Flavobacterium sp. H122]|uniref:DUF5689 domain-containing protein n=1 Tax=Flavobacterium sp. H122 TaxID=2529860 RepID=UPI0010A9B2BE|nr:DUF5689 domain-containing protein [Flavobacterium sp. H122]